MQAPTPPKKAYTISGPKGLPVLGMAVAAQNDPIGFLLKNSLEYGDLIPCHMFGKKFVQVNHPDFIRQILIDNHKNYHKSSSYRRLEPALGQSLFTSNGDKWKRDRQTIQPMFKREKIEGYYFDVVCEVGEKYKQRWLTLTRNGPARFNMTDEMANITMEIILKLVFGKDNLPPQIIGELHRCFNVAMEYSKVLRILPDVHMRKIFGTPSYRKFAKALEYVENFVKQMADGYEGREDRDYLLALLMDVHKENPEQFTARDVRDQAIGMVFGGFETTSILIQWMWYVLDSRPDVEAKLRSEIETHAPGEGVLAYETINKMDYLEMVIKETMRMYPPIWATARSPVSTDMLGDYKIEPGTEVVLPQIIMHRHPRWWDKPNAFIPERFSAENEANLDSGLYFPFSHGLRKCIGYRLAEVEAKTLFIKLFPLFKVTCLNVLDNGFDPSVSLKLSRPLEVEMRRL